MLVAAAALDAVWIYHDTKHRTMDTADMWAIGFSVAFVSLPVFSGFVVFVFYLRN